MRLLAISDLHLGYEVNRRAVAEMPAHLDDWLIVAGDLGEATAHLRLGLELLAPKFRQLVWTPGNHDLWTLPDRNDLRGEFLYREQVALCRAWGVLTPEDPFAVWAGAGGPCAIAPVFALYDYSFRPADVPREQALEWALQSGVMCADENYLFPDPHASREAWCAARCALTEARLAEIPPELPTVLVSHFPLHPDVVRLPAVPRFSLWCGTMRSRDWHRRFRARVVVSGHLHVRSTNYLDGVRFEEVSLGYPPQWDQRRPVAAYLREILPGPTPPVGWGTPSGA